MPSGAPHRPAMQSAAPWSIPSLGVRGCGDSLPSLALLLALFSPGLRERKSPAQDARGKVRTGSRFHEPPGKEAWGQVLLSSQTARKQAQAWLCNLETGAAHQTSEAGYPTPAPSATWQAGGVTQCRFVPTSRSGEPSPLPPDPTQPQRNRGCRVPPCPPSLPHRRRLWVDLVSLWPICMPKPACPLCLLAFPSPRLWAPLGLRRWCQLSLDCVT